MTIVASNVTPLIFQSTLDAVTFTKPHFYADVLHVRSFPRRSHANFPSDNKELFQKTWLLIFLARMRVWCPINLDPFMKNSFLFPPSPPGSPPRYRSNLTYLQCSHSPFPIPIALNNGRVHTAKVKAICRFRIRALSAVQKKINPSLYPHHNLLWEWQPWRRLTMWPRTKGKMSSHCPQWCSPRPPRQGQGGKYNLGWQIE